MVSIVTVVGIAFLAGGATGLGALPVFVADRVSHRIYDAAIGLAAGVMFGAAVFALLVPGLDFGSLWEVVVGLFVGAVFLLVANRVIPHIHLVGRGEGDRTYPPSAGAETVLEPTPSDRPETTDADETELNSRRALLVGSAITIHNVPEGLAIGIAFASGLEGVGIALAIAIAIQNVPDGFAMAIPASRTGLSNAKTILYTTLSGAIPEPIAAALGFALVATSTGLFPIAAGFAAGTMMAVIFRELIPASHGHGYADIATLTFVTGFAIMVIVDVGLAV